MSEEDFIDALPIELFLKLLSYLRAKELMKCRIVSFRWKDIIDDVIERTGFWYRRCEFDFSSVVTVASKKCRRGMGWSDLYRSLTLWSKLSDAKEEQDEFCSAAAIRDEILSFTILRHGVIGVHKRSVIMYYDIETFKPTTQPPIPGDFIRYAENDRLLVILNAQVQLYIFRKLMFDPMESKMTLCDDIKTFLLHDDSVYYIDFNDDLFMVTCKDMQLDSHFQSHFSEAVLALGIRDGILYVLTYKRKIYTVKDKKLVLITTLESTSNLLHQINKYNLLQLLDWRIYIQWIYILRQPIPQGPLHDIVTARMYGDVVFVGSNWGVLQIYYQPYTLGELDLFNAEPVKQYNFMERCDCPVLSICPIVTIDVFEVDDGHTVVVAMPKKIAILKYRHDVSFKCYDETRVPTLSEVELRVVETTD